MKFYRIPLFLTLFSSFLLITFAQTVHDAPATAADAGITCKANELFNGQVCTCAPGYFSSHQEDSRERCDNECEEQYFSYFTYGKCVKGIFDKVKANKEDKVACDSKCGARLRLWASIGIFSVFAASVATLIFTIPMCIATCASCLHSRKASKHSKRIYAESQIQPNKDQQQVSTMSYNPYAYWPYYGRG